MAGLTFAAPVPAAAPAFLFQIPSDPTPGSGAGQLNNPRDVAANPDTGHIYVSELNNDRISEFTAWGTFVRAWGWDVSPDGAPGDTPSDEFEICNDICQQATTGSGAGQFLNPTGLTVDASGSVYVYDRENRRVQKFTASGSFLLMFGSGVNQGPANPGDVCTATDLIAADTCGAGSGGDGNARLESNHGNYIAHNPATDSIFVGDTDMIQQFDLDGTFHGSIMFEDALSEFDERSVSSLDADSAGNLYTAFEGLGNVHKLSPTGDRLTPVFLLGSPFAIAVDASTNLYAMQSQVRVLGFDSTGGLIDGMEPADNFAKPIFGSSRIGLGTNLCTGSEVPGNLFVSEFSFGTVSKVDVYGTGPIGCESPPLKAPQIVDQYAMSVGVEEATVRAEIDPHFWADTTYYVQYGPQQCLDSDWTEGCQMQPTPPGSTLTSKATSQAVPSAGVQLGSLQPDTVYHYRFIAQSTGSDGQPVVGVGGDIGDPGESARFQTFSRPGTLSDDCPNADRRGGPSAALPDCRAYEMVSPHDKNDGDIAVPENRNNYPVSLVQAARDGGALTYSSLFSFGDTEAAPLTTQYLTRRSPVHGWASETISPPRTRQVGDFQETEFKQFTPNLCQGWLRHDADPPLALGAVAGYFNLYRRDYCGDNGYEALTVEVPPFVSCTPDPGICPSRYFPLELQGTSSDGSKAIYVAPDNLVDASVNNDERVQLYYFADGSLRFVCIRPNGVATPEGCSAGTYGNDHGNGRLSSLQNAISDDGSLVYWSEGPKLDLLQPGLIDPRRLFVRENPARDQSALVAGQCTEPEKGCTYPVSSPVSPDRAQFWAAAADGSRAIFTIENGPLAGNLYLFALEKAKAGETANTLIADGVKGVLGVSEDASRIYFASTKDLDGGAEAQSGDLNLYFHDSEVGISDFIGVLAAYDVAATGEVIAAVHKFPFWRSSRVSSDGAHIAFTSFASLTGYDNRDVASGERDLEVFHYAAETGKLTCVSCSLTGSRPTGRQIQLDRPIKPWIAARIPGWERALYASRVLSDDGRRLFFESFDALVPEDANGMQDVYQWEQVGKGSCDEADPTYNPDNGGCVELISSGTSDRDSSFVDASASGDDVFFTTLSSLVPPDYGLVDIYDARVNGGFAYPEPARQCEGEACQSPPAPPDDPTPASSSFNGAGNVDPAKTCRKGTVLRRGRCVPKRCKKGTVRRKGRCVSRKRLDTRRDRTRQSDRIRAAG